jgi:ribosomal protein S12 methylthiotransferase accessory factor
VETFPDHATLFNEPAQLPELAFLLDAPERRRLSDLTDHARGAPAADLEALTATLEDVGSRVAYVDLTTPDVASVGMRVVRALATELQPVHFGHRRERLGGRRLFTLPRTLGYRAHDATEAEINPCPHPLS